MEGEGDTYHAQKRCWISCPLCEVTMQANSLPAHYRALHPGSMIPRAGDQPTDLAPEQANYLVSEPDKKAPIQCPVTLCSVNIVGGWYALRWHFFFRHTTCTIHIIKEGELLACHRCGFQCPLPHMAHKASALCLTGYNRRQQCNHTQAIILGRDFTPEFAAGDTTFDNVADFKYLGQWMSTNDSDITVVAQNIKKARQQWGQLCRLLTRHGANRWVMGLFYKATIQAVLLYGAETWTLTQPLRWQLCSFHHRCTRYLARMTTTQQEDGSWISPPSSVAHERAGLATIEEYIQRRVNTYLPFIQSPAIFRECRLSQPTQAAANHLIWWAAYPMPTPAMAEEMEEEGTQYLVDNNGEQGTGPLWWAAAYHTGNTEPTNEPVPAPDPFPLPRRWSPRCTT